jgi:hypothetical protein
LTAIGREAFFIVNLRETRAGIGSAHGISQGSCQNNRAEIAEGGTVARTVAARLPQIDSFQ